jgi:hypothetical protein
MLPEIILKLHAANYWDYSRIFGSKQIPHHTGYAGNSNDRNHSDFQPLHGGKR